MNKNAKAVIRYHEETKHHYHRYARSSGYMDWRNQPDPFRFYEGTGTVDLPLTGQEPEAGYPGLYRRENNRTQPVTLKHVAKFLELSMGLSAWKVSGSSRWSLRMNPSSGNLHPTECHLVIPSASDIAPGVYHYNPLKHILERRADLPEALCEKIQSHFHGPCFLAGLSSIFWRESWKYGERAFRYCNHDVGHALAALSFSANLQGWKLTALTGLSDDDIGTVLGFDRTPWRPTEAEHPDLLCVAHPPDTDVPRTLPTEMLSAFSALPFEGTPNMLSKEPVNWEIIYETAARTRKPRTVETPRNYGQRPLSETPGSSLTAAAIIRQRRSAAVYSGRGGISKARFCAMLEKTLPRSGVAPFDLELGEPHVNLLLFVHRVDGLERGIYFLIRTPDTAETLRPVMAPDLEWKSVRKDFPLWRLRQDDFRQDAISVSCDQGIAGYSAFSLGMIARFREVVTASPWAYRHLFWETGMIGQVLYLEAEAHGVRGTGIGCFFDDPVHELLGLRDNTWQSLYHFTVGDPVEDTRISTLPPYGHLQRG
ncbi:hypothetical protein DENIS_1448 [Desulfonema ishimotonii]|uniref:Nitroreductase domain-containing protein n=2 Tax=Desulfonema ishimotonii TaxID=45657 RepID=A0A401FU64_9BACT|nr:hypothetical protein DENIS_1448 [Desulfonema ishimotonii]